MTRHTIHNIEPGIDLSYVDLPGSDLMAAPVVMLHGLGANAESTFLSTANDIRLQHHRRLLIDLPGFGQSTVPTAWPASVEDHAKVVTQFLEHLGLTNLTLVGHSMGGSIAIMVASQCPDLVATLIIAEPNLDPGTGTFSGQITRFSERAFIQRGRGMILRALNLEKQRNPQIRDNGFAQSVAQASPVHLHRSAVSLRAKRTPTFRAQLHTLLQPRLFIVGNTCVEAINGEVTPYGVELAVIDRAGHSMMHDDPDEFVRVISEFLIARL